jgi:hypothetical protein
VPVTVDEFLRLGIVPIVTGLKAFDEWLCLIPAFFICVAFVLVYVMHKLEQHEPSTTAVDQTSRDPDMQRYFKRPTTQDWSENVNCLKQLI